MLIVFRNSGKYWKLFYHLRLYKSDQINKRYKNKQKMIKLRAMNGRRTYRLVFDR